MVNPDGTAGRMLRTFYTGFAHIAKMYFDRTGKALLFYPLYSDMDERAFRIGEPVAYDPRWSLTRASADWRSSCSRGWRNFRGRNDGRRSAG